MSSLREELELLSDLERQYALALEKGQQTETPESEGERPAPEEQGE